MAAGLEALVSHAPQGGEQIELLKRQTQPTTPTPTGPYKRGATSPLGGQAVRRK
jgi:hypothetical protein